MIARSFKSVGWVAGIGAAALSCYMLSLQVAAERAELAGVEARIVRARQAIRDLQTELGTRGRLSQLEHWNAEVLALSAPVAGQFVDDEVVLARLETRSSELAGGAPVRLASAESGSAAPAAVPAQPQVRTAAAANAAPAVPARAVVRRASLDSATPAAAAPARPAPTRASIPVAARPTLAAAAPPRRDARAAPSRTAALLDDRTARELGEASRAERSQRSSGGGDARPRADRAASQD